MLYMTLPFSDHWGQDNTDNEWRNKTYNMWEGSEGWELLLLDPSKGSWDEKKEDPLLLDSDMKLEPTENIDTYKLNK